MANYHKIIIPTRPHPDVIVGIFLLREFGQGKYSGMENCKVEIWQELAKGETYLSCEQKGILLLDIGGGKLDHHSKGDNLAKLIAKELEILNDPALAKILAYSERDDKYGLGTVSTDSLDKAFGLSGLVAALNKTIEDPEKVIEITIPFLKAHYAEEKRRAIELPQEFEEKLSNGTAEVFESKQDGKKLKIVALESDNLSMAGWLKSSSGLKADIVCQRKSSGYTNIMTKPLKRIDLRWPAAYLRNEEIYLRGKKLNYTAFDLMRPGKIAEIPEWYYDKATNSILNGGASPKGILPTAISFERVKEILKESLPQNLPGRN